MRECAVIAEIGINHNGDLNTAIDMMDVAADAGCDCVKFQKRDPDLCVPKEQRDIIRETPWGKMPYIDYKKRIEFGDDEYNVIDEHAERLGIKWFMSVWDMPSLLFAARYKPPAIKIPSALNENLELIIEACGVPGAHVIVSTGMLETNGFQRLHSVLEKHASEYTLMHAVSAYPLNDEDAELAVLAKLFRETDNKVSVGYSDHTRGIHMAVAAVGMGATMIEKHITLDRTMWGTDQSASIEPPALKKMVRNIRAVCEGWGNGAFAVRECEAEAKRRLKG